MKFFQPEMDDLQGWRGARVQKPMAYCLFLIGCLTLALGLSGTNLASFLLHCVVDLLACFQGIVSVGSMSTSFLVVILISVLVLLHCCFDLTWLMAMDSTSQPAGCVHDTSLGAITDLHMSGWNFPGRLLGQQEYDATESYPLLSVDDSTCQDALGLVQGTDDEAGVDVVGVVKLDDQCEPDTSQLTTDNGSSCCRCSEKSDLQQENDLRACPEQYDVDPSESSTGETLPSLGKAPSSCGPLKTQSATTQTGLPAQNLYVTIGTMTSHPETVDVAVGSQKRYKVVRHVDTCTTGLFMKKLRRAQRVLREARLKFQSDQRTKLDNYRTVLTRYGGRLHGLLRGLQRKDMLLSCTAVTRAISASEVKDICTAVSSARDRLVTQCKLNFALKEVVDSKCEPPPSDSQQTQTS